MSYFIISLSVINQQECMWSRELNVDCIHHIKFMYYHIHS